MNMIKCGFIGLFITLCMQTANAQAYQSFYVSPKVHLLSDLDVTEEFIGFNLDLGMNWNDYLRTELGVSNLGDISSEGSDIYLYQTNLVGVLPVSDYSNFFLGVGAALSNSDSLINDVLYSAKLGLDYKMSDAWSFVVDYKYYHDLEVKNYGSIGSQYAFEAGLVYRFGQSAQVLEAQVPLPPVDEPEEILVVEPVAPPPPPVEQEIVVEPVAIEVKPEKAVVQDPNKHKVMVSCYYDVITTDYTVVKGDYLIKIANKHDLPYEQLKFLNPKYFDARNPNLIYPGEKIKLKLVKERAIKKCDEYYELEQ